MQNTIIQNHLVTLYQKLLWRPFLSRSSLKQQTPKHHNFTDSENFERIIPKLIPTQKTFSEALDEIETPLRTLIDAINPLDFVQPALPSTKEVLATYLEQLDYLLRWSCINGKKIGEAKIEHPFWIVALDEH